MNSSEGERAAVEPRLSEIDLKADRAIAEFQAIRTIIESLWTRETRVIVAFAAISSVFLGILGLSSYASYQNAKERVALIQAQVDVVIAKAQETVARLGEEAEPRIAYLEALGGENYVTDGEKALVEVNIDYSRNTGSLARLRLVVGVRMQVEGPPGEALYVRTVWPPEALDRLFQLTPNGTENDRVRFSEGIFTKLDATVIEGFGFNLDINLTTSWLPCRKVEAAAEDLLKNEYLGKISFEPVLKRVGAAKKTSFELLPTRGAYTTCSELQELSEAAGVGSFVTNDYDASPELSPE